MRKSKKKPLSAEEESEAKIARYSARVALSIANAHELAGHELWRQAASELRPLAKDVPGSTELWLQIARWEQADGRAKDAEATLRHAIELNSSRQQKALPLWHALALHLAEEQQWEQAAQAAQQGVKLARALSRQPSEDENPDAASEWATAEPKAARLRQHEFLELLGTAYAHQSLFEEAGQAMRSLLELSPRDPLHRMRLGSLLQSHGALGEAAREFERVAEMSPGTFFASDAESALEMLDKAQIQQILMRAGEQRSFGLRLERDMEATLDSHAFYLSENGRESLRQMIDDGRPDLSRAPRPH